MRSLAYIEGMAGWKPRCPEFIPECSLLSSKIGRRSAEVRATPNGRTKATTLNEERARRRAERERRRGLRGAQPQAVRREAGPRAWRGRTGTRTAGDPCATSGFRRPHRHGRLQSAPTNMSNRQSRRMPPRPTLLMFVCLFVKGTCPRGRNSALSRWLASASASTHSGPVVVMSPRVPLQGGCEGIQVGGRG